MKEIPLTRGKVAIVDDADYAYLSQVEWRTRFVNGLQYAVRQEKQGKKLKTIYMHQMLLPTAKEIDHKDGNGLNNRRGNLRPCTHAQNMSNRKVQKNNTSGYKGVHWMKDKGKYRARLRIGGGQISLGLFDDPAEAARAYDDAAREHFGEFARTNFS